MRLLPSFIAKRLNSWDEMCMDENARLRTNNILCTLAISLLSFSMLIFNLVSGGLELVLFVTLLVVISLTLFFVNLLNEKYNIIAAWAFGIMALFMSAFMLYSGAINGYSHLWIFMVPSVAIMVVNVKQSIPYNIILLAIVIAMLNTPLQNLLQATYSRSFKIIFPIALVFVMCCMYIAELMRYQTQTRLRSTAKKLESFAFTDPLTGCYNRRAFTSHFGDTKEPAHGLSFAMLDLDYFKEINDTHGHVVGDNMLCHVVNIVSAAIPPNAHLYRWGGEEFLVVLKTDDIALLAETMETIRKKIQATPLPAEGQPITVTVSIGCHAALPGMQVGECISSADSHLYAAKTAGRNRVVANPAA